jgi:hypothetical protein
LEFEPPVTITKKADDPAGILRISLGGDSEIGFYCEYRGTKEAAADALLLAAKAMALLVVAYGAEEPAIVSDEGKKFA